MTPNGETLAELKQRKIEQLNRLAESLQQNADDYRTKLSDIIRIAKGGEMLSLSEMETRIEELTTERDELRKMLEELKHAIEQDHWKNESKYCLCCSALMNLIQDEPARECRNPHCPLVKARALLDRVGGGS